MGPHHAQPSAVADYTAKCRFTNELCQSGSSQLVPVVPGCGGAQPGQNRDTSAPPVASVAPGTEDEAPELPQPLPSICRGGCAHRRPRRRRKGTTNDPDDCGDEGETGRDVERLVAEANRRLPREKAQAVGAICARYSNRDQHSIVDQVRACLDWAVNNGVFVARGHVFCDEARTGRKSRRAGVQGLRAALAANDVEVVLAFATSRLFRKTYKSLQFVEEEVVERGKRCVFVRSGVDTADKERWRALLHFYSIIDEFVIQMTVKHIQAGHEGLLESGRVFGTITFGYKGEPIPGAFTRRDRPARTLVIDPVTSVWVEQQ